MHDNNYAFVPLLKHFPKVVGGMEVQLQASLTLVLDWGERLA